MSRMNSEIALFVFLLVSIFMSGCREDTPDLLLSQEPLFTIGLVADIQYADRDAIPKYNSYYRPSLQKLEECVNVFNQHDLEYAIQLGDFVDRDFESYDTVLPIWNKIQCKKYHVIGNHDLQDTSDYAHVMEKLSMDENYYDFSVKGWRFIVLDTSEISLFAQPKGSDRYKLAQSIISDLEQKGSVKAKPWNGTMSEKQLQWLDVKLKIADDASENVIVFGHYPVITAQPRLLAWNSEKIVTILESHPSFKAYICGHDHDGGYAVQNGRHYLILNGMMATPDTNAYAVMGFYDDYLLLDGFGRIEDRKMELMR